MPYKLIEKGKSDDGTYTGKQLAEKLNVSISTIYKAARNHAFINGCLVLKVRSEGEQRDHRRKCRGCGRWFMGKEREYFCLYCRRIVGVRPEDEIDIGRMIP